MPHRTPVIQSADEMSTTRVSFFFDVVNFVDLREFRLRDVMLMIIRSYRRVIEGGFWLKVQAMPILCYYDLA